MEKIIVYAEAEYSEIKLQAEIVSVREYSFGRGYLYGVKFILEDFEDKRIYYDFLQYWNGIKRELDHIDNIYLSDHFDSTI